MRCHGIIMLSHSVIIIVQTYKPDGRQSISLIYSVVYYFKVERPDSAWPQKHMWCV